MSLREMFPYLKSYIYVQWQNFEYELKRNGQFSLVVGNIMPQMKRYKNICEGLVILNLLFDYTTLNFEALLSREQPQSPDVKTC